MIVAHFVERLQTRSVDRCLEQEPPLFVVKSFMHHQFRPHVFVVEKSNVVHKLRYSEKVTLIFKLSLFGLAERHGAHVTFGEGAHVIENMGKHGRITIDEDGARC